MAEIRASEIETKMRIQEDGIGELFVTATGWHGDTVLITDQDGGEHTFDRDTVVELLPPKMVCPVCGSGDNLVSNEVSTAGYHGVRFYQDPDDPSKPDLDYDHADTRWGDGEGFIDDIQCDNHTLLELSFSDLVPEDTPPNPNWTRAVDRPAKTDE